MREPNKTPRSLAEALRRGLVPRQFLREALLIVFGMDSDAPVRRQPYPRPDPSWRNNNDPGFDDVVRAMEEDRE